MSTDTIVELNGQPLTLEQIHNISQHFGAVALAPYARTRMAQSQAVVERIVASDQAAYGINTGFGKLSDVRIAPEHLQQLQRNLYAVTRVAWANLWKNRKRAPCCCCARMFWRKV